MGLQDLPEILVQQERLDSQGLLEVLGPLELQDYKDLLGIPAPLEQLVLQVSPVQPEVLELLESRALLVQLDLPVSLAQQVVQEQLVQEVQLGVRDPLEQPE